MEISVGTGENRFSMKRGSFRYKQKIYSRKKLVQQSREKRKDGYILTYADASELSSQCRKYLFAVKTNGSRIEVSCVGAEDNGLNRYWITIRTNAEDHIYGCGETYSKLDLKGEKVRIWVAEHQNTNRIAKKIIREKLTGKHPDRVEKFSRYESYYAQPTFTSSDRYFFHAYVDTYSEFDFRVPGEMTFYFQEAPHFVTDRAGSFTELSQKLSALLGRQRVLPDWTYDGAILAVQEGTGRVENKIENAVAAGVKVCGVWCQDWSGCRRNKFGYQVMWNWKWDQELYPGLDRKIAEWKEKGIRFLGYINPFLALEGDVYGEASQKGYCVKDAEGKDYLVTITVFPAAMIDFTNPKAYEWYKNLIKKNMIELGMGGWMADFGEYLPTDAVLFSGEDPAVIHNQWPVIWAKMNQEAIAECGKENEIFFFTRAGYTGSIRHSAMMWTGDHHVDWSVDDGLPAVIPATLSLAMSGFGVTHSDTGGYTTMMQMRRSRELLMRWEEMNVFSPLFRTHEGNQPVNNVQFDDDGELLHHLARCAAMHSALKEYLKMLAYQQQEAGTPMMRPLFYHYDEEKAYLEKTEYLLGEDLLVAPVYKEGAEARKCFLPNDVWVHLFTGREYHGGDVTVEAPLGKPPVFLRKSSSSFSTLMQIAEI